MIPTLRRVLAVAILGGLAGAAFLILAYGVSPEVSLKLDRDLPANASGFYPVELGPTGPFVWTSGEAALTLPGLDRRVPWRCVVRLRGARPDPSTQPQVIFAVDGVAVLDRRATNDFTRVEIPVPARAGRRGLALSLTAAPTFVPGGGDPRALGVMVDELGCRPAGNEPVLPPPTALRNAAASSALFGAAAALIGVTAGSAIGAAAVAAAGQSVPFSVGIAPYSGFPATAVWLALWLSALLAAVVFLIERWRRVPFRNTARFVVIFSAGALYFKLLALLHPSKPLVDALFQAHRFEWVLAGRYYFTQLSTSATPFPYAIGLYLFAAPWTLFTHDYVTLLRVVVCASEVIAGALIYVMVVRTWGDRLTGAVAVALFNLVPVSYVVVGHANLTNAFGQSVALATVAAVTVWSLESRRIWQLVAVVLLSTLAFISHVSTFTLLPPILLVVAVLYHSMGGPALRAPARAVVLATALAAVLSVVLYYGHFGDLYKAQFERLRADAVTALTPPERQQAAGEPQARAADPQAGPNTIPLGSRVAEALAQTGMNVGWPILILALLGAWRVWAEGARDRLGLVVAAWVLTGVAFLLLSVLIPVDRRYHQDVWEFIGRVQHATYPAAVILAARGAVWGWRDHTRLRVASGLLLAWALWVGAREWVRWIV